MLILKGETIEQRTKSEPTPPATLLLSSRCCQVDLHFRTLDFGQVTVGSSNVRNLAVTNNLPQAVLAELVGLEGQSELAGTSPPAQVVPAGATAGFDVHFKCHTEQVTLETRVERLLLNHADGFCFARE